MVRRIIVGCWINAAGAWQLNAGFWIEKLKGLIQFNTKGLTNLDDCEPLDLLVGGAGFEPATSTV